MSDTMMPEAVEKLIAYFYEELPKYEENPDYTPDPADYPAETVAPADLEAALREIGVPEEDIARVLDQYEASGDYTAGTVINIVYEDNSANNYIDQSNNLHGEFHGDVDLANTNTTANATGDGAVAAGGDQEGVTAQQGDGSQFVGGSNDGVLNQGDNSGQIAGNDAVNTGDFTSGDGNVSADGAYISDSGVNFGEGGTVDNVANDDYTAHSYNDGSTEHNVTAEANDSGNYSSSYEDNFTSTSDSHVNDSGNFTAEVHGEDYGHKADPYEAPEPKWEETEKYEPVEKYEPEPKYDEDPHQDAHGDYDGLAEG